MPLQECMCTTRYTYAAFSAARANGTCAQWMPNTCRKLHPSHNQPTCMQLIVGKLYMRDKRGHAIYANTIKFLKISKTAVWFCWRLHREARHRYCTVIECCILYQEQDIICRVLPGFGRFLPDFTFWVWVRFGFPCLVTVQFESFEIFTWEPINRYTVIRLWYKKKVDIPITCCIGAEIISQSPGRGCFLPDFFSFWLWTFRSCVRFILICPLDSSFCPIRILAAKIQ